jgi:phosphonate transport system ATP-binding protein
MQSAVRISNIRKTYGSSRAAVDISSLEIHTGERVALIGASGSGKSTLLRTLSGLEMLDKGTGHIEIFGQTMQKNGALADDARDQRLEVGVIFQQFNLVGRLPVITNVLLGLAPKIPTWRAILGRFSEEEKVRALQALAAVGIQEQAFQRASTLSGGQQQRAAIARVLVQGARLLLADEPVASLDPESSTRVMELLIGLNRDRGVTLLISLHSLEIAQRYCDRVIALKDGVVVFDGATQSLDAQFLQQLYGLSASSSALTSVSPNPSIGQYLRPNLHFQI